MIDLKFQTDENAILDFKKNLKVRRNSGYMKPFINHRHFCYWYILSFVLFYSVGTFLFVII